MNKEREITGMEIEKAMSAFCPFGWRDIESALGTIYQAEGQDYVDTEKLSSIINEFSGDTGIEIYKVDPVACVYDYYHQMARTEIEKETGKDISNDNPYSGVNVSGNYMCTSIDGSDEDREALKKLIETIPELDRSSVVNWLYEQL